MYEYVTMKPTSTYDYDALIKIKIGMREIIKLEIKEIN